MRTFLKGALIVTMLAVAGCRAAPLYNATDLTFAQPATQATLSLEDYKKAIIRAGAKRNWSFEEAGPGHLIGSVAVRAKHFATVDVTFDTEQFSITYNNSRNLNYNAGRNEIHPNYNTWVKNLQKDIQAEITRLKAS